IVAYKSKGISQNIMRIYFYLKRGLFIILRLLKLGSMFFGILPAVLAQSQPAVNNNCYQANQLTLQVIQSLLVSNLRGWDFFSIGNSRYLAAAEFTDNYPTGNKDIDSHIFQWDGKKFVTFQSILTHGARNWSYVSIHGKHFLMVANLQTSQHQKNSYKVNSIIYQWNGKRFISYQKIPTDQVVDLKFAKIRNNYYLILASISKNSYSPIYKWDGKRFKPYQRIKTSEIYGFQIFTIHGNTYLAMGSGGNTSSIYIWKNNRFVLAQSLPIGEVRGVTFFSHQNHQYLALASQAATSSIYQWMGNQFSLVKKDSLAGGRDWLYLVYSNNAYLLLSHFIHNQPKDTIFYLSIYKFKGHTIVKIEDLPTYGIGEMVAFQMNNTQYVLLNRFFADTPIYKVSKQGCQ